MQFIPDVKLAHLPKLEFWVATVLYVLAAVVLLFRSADQVAEVYFLSGTQFHFNSNHFIPLLCQYTGVYLGFLYLNFLVIPRLLQKKKLWLQVLIVLLVFGLLGLLFGITDTYVKAYLFASFSIDRVYNEVFTEGFAHALAFILLMAFYSLIKYAGLRLLGAKATKTEVRQEALRESYVAFLLWLMVLALLVLLQAKTVLKMYWGVLLLHGILLYCFAFYRLLPKAITCRRPIFGYLWRVTLVLVLTFFPVMLLGLIFTDSEDDATVMAILNGLFQILFTVPLAWVLFQRHRRRYAELYALQHQLGQSEANLDFLRSQINPHFLFNTLNTLYGTALQENAHRSAHGIQMLGDMMRFMLHENHQLRIPLSREIGYMSNYIELQSLRTSTSPNIAIDTKIEEVPDAKFIAPMLLIPFVENAFKHGISLKHKSWIKVALRVVEGNLYFDVYNSRHLKPDNDPEKDKSGVGLANVQQRLAMLYPERHELLIRETQDEFFIHLTLQL